MLEYTLSPKIKPSPAEVMVAKHLRDNNVHFLQEVSFQKCKNPETGYLLRFDFYLPALNILIEYDGIASHKDAGVKKRDAIKSKFAKENGMRLIRIQGMQKIKGISERLAFGTPAQKVKSKQIKAKPKPKPKKKGNKNHAKQSILSLLSQAASGPYRSKKTK